MELFYRESGDGPPLVIMHGVFGTSDNWLTISKELSVSNKVFLLDLRNHGQSFHSDIFNFDVMASDLHSFLSLHNILDPVIIGHSMGGKVAMKYASVYNNFSKLIIVDIGPRFYKRHDNILKGLNAINLSEIGTRQQADTALAPYVPETGVRQFLLKNLYRTENNKFAWHLNLKILTEQIDNIGEALDESIRISKPTLFIKGSLSHYIQDKDVLLINTIFSNVKIIPVEGAGHWVQAERPKEFVEAVKKFLKEG